MCFKRIKRIVVIFCEIMLLSGCTATYNLEISPSSVSETLIIDSISVNDSNYFVPAYYNSINDDYYDVDVNQKIEGISYYNSVFDSNQAIFDYKFNGDDFSKSNFVNSFFSIFVFQRYDHDEDGVDDYYGLSVNDDFSAFDLYNQLTEVTIKIKSNCEVISSNADNIDGNVYTWYLTKDDLKSINLVYNPDKVVDYRTFWEKLKDGEYTNIFTISILLIVVALIIYFVLKRKGDRMNKI